MNNETFEKAQLFMRVWQEAAHLGEQAMMAVAFALRNRQRAGWEGGFWLKVIEHADRLRYNDAPLNLDWPDLRDPIVHRVLARIDGVYDGSASDNLTSVTAPMPIERYAWQGGDSAQVRTGKYWAELSGITNKEFLERIVRDPASHPKTSTVGSLTFFA